MNRDPASLEIDRPKFASAAAERAPACVLTDATAQFSRQYNRKSFLFEHGLATHPLFELPSLVALAERTPGWEHYWANGSVRVGSGWGSGTGQRYSLPDTIANIAENDSMVILKHTEQDSIFGPVLQDFLGRVVAFSGEAMRSDVVLGETLILVTSPNRITPYHFDSEVNFLVQVRGDKWFHVFDRKDTPAVTHEELERYFDGNVSSGVYRPERESEATVYNLHAGQGVHVPVAVPHWVQNKDNVSVAISVNYDLRSVYRLTRLYRMNSRMRRLGWRPTPPGVSAWRDGVKLTAAGGAAYLRALLKGRQAPRPYGTWSPSQR